MSTPESRTVVSGGALVQLTDPLRQQTLFTSGAFGPEVPNLDYQSRRYGMASGMWRDPETAYRYQPNLRMVVDYCATRGATVPLTAYQRVSDTERVRLGDDTVIGRTLGEPYPKVGQARFMFDLLLDALLWDRWAFVMGIHAQTGRTAWVRMPPSWWHYGPGLVGQRSVIMDALGAPLDPAVVVADSGRAQGVSGVWTLGETLAALDEMTSYRNQVYRNGARVTAAIERPLEAPEWTDDAKERFRDSWHRAWAGNGPEAGGTPILEDGMKLSQVDVFSPEALQYVEGRLASLIEVCAFYHVAPELIGARPGTYSNMQSHRVALYQETLGPIMAPIEQAITIQAARPMMSDDVSIYCEFNVESMLRGTFEEQAQVLQSSVGAPWLSRNEARALYNRPPVPGGDDLIVPLNVITGGLANPRDTAPKHLRSSGAKQAGGRTIATHRNRLTAALTSWYEETQREILPQLAEPAPPAMTKGIPVLEMDTQSMASDLRARIRPHTGEAAHVGVKRMLDTYGTADIRNQWDDSEMAPWLDTQADRSSNQVVNALHHNLLDTLTQPDTQTLAAGVFSAAIGRAATLAGDLASGAYHLGQSDGAKVTGVRAKSWSVTSPNPRESHAAMDGETVGTFDTFSNGGRWPGDPNLPVEETAGCTCELEWSQT